MGVSAFVAQNEGAQTYDALHVSSSPDRRASATPGFALAAGSLDDWPGRPTGSQCLLLCPWLGSTGEAMTVGRARSASGFTVATLNFRTEDTS